jgi:hypothetical protein
MPNAAQLQSITAHQSKIAEIDRAIKMTQNFLDQKAFMPNERGAKVLMTRQELFDLREKEEAEIVKLR